MSFSSALTIPCGISPTWWRNLVALLQYGDKVFKVTLTYARHLPAPTTPAGTRSFQVVIWLPFFRVCCYG